MFGWLSKSVSPAEVRAEVWKLGVRHHGEPLRGALEELAQGGSDGARTQLLQACVRELRRA